MSSERNRGTDGSESRKVNGEMPPSRPPKRRPGQPRRYGRLEEDALLAIRKHLGYPGPRKLVGGLARAIESLERHGELTLCPEVRENLPAMSSSTVGRIIVRRRHGPRPAARRPLNRRQAVMPVRTWDTWNGARPGDLQVDLASHSGPSARGGCLYTLVACDVCTGWIEVEVLPGRMWEHIWHGLSKIRARLPFRWTGFHSDNGSEFMNGPIADWSRAHGIERTRGRPGKSVDQAHVELRIRTFVRKLTRNRRFEGDASKALAGLYAPAIAFANFFDAWEKRGDRARASYDRLLDSGVLDPDARRSLEKQLRGLNLAQLRREIDRGVVVLRQHAVYL